MSSPVSFPLTFVSMAPRASFDFADGAAPFALSGPASSSLLTFRSADTVCEDGGSCLALGPFTPCGLYPSTTITGWLVAPAPITHVHVRYRALEHDGEPAPSTHPLTLMLIGDDDAPISTSLVDETAPFSPTTELGMERTTAWTTATFAVREPTAEVGFALGISINCPDESPRFDPASDFGTAIVLVSGVTAD